MSGMCERSAFDTFYHMDNDEKGLVTFYGFESSIIRYDTKQRLWVLTIINKPDLICPPEKTQHPSLVTSLFSDSINSRGWDIYHPQSPNYRTFATPEFVHLPTSKTVHLPGRQLPPPIIFLLLAHFHFGFDFQVSLASTKASSWWCRRTRRRRWRTSEVTMEMVDKKGGNCPPGK